MSSLREQIAAKRAEAAKSTPSSRAESARAAAGRASAALNSSRAGGSSSEMLEDRTVSSQIRRAARSGKLDIAGLGLDRVPSEVYTELLGLTADQLSRPPPATTAGSDMRGLSTDLESKLHVMSREEAFGQAGRKHAEQAEPEEITLFRAGNNRIDQLEAEFGAFGGLTTIDLSSNQLTGLPNSFADLLRLTSVDLSHNGLTEVPPALLTLPKLEVLDLSHNHITAIALGHPINASEEAYAYGAGFLTTAFSRAFDKGPKPVWPALRSLNLGYNRIINTGLQGLKLKGGLKGVRLLNLESNALEGQLDAEESGIGTGDMPGLAKLVLSGNPYLQGVQGELAPRAQVLMEGCNSSAPRAPVAGPASASAAQDSSAESSKPELPVPKPDLTLVFKACPAATFDSLPLDIDMDVYLPEQPSTHAVVIWFHGGGLLQGNKENLPPHFRRLPSHAYDTASGQQSVIVISPNYRLAPQVPIIDILSDVTAVIDYVKTKLNAALENAGKAHKVDTGRICLSGGSAGGYLAMIGGMLMPSRVSDEDVGGYRGESGIRCIAPFYPITDLTDPFWATETDPVPWWDRSIPHDEARPHTDLKAAPVKSAVSGGPRSILYPYMLQHALFPSLLFMKQRSLGSGSDSFRPTPEALSITTRLDLLAKHGVSMPPTYLVYGTKDDKVQPFDKTEACLRKVKAEVVIERREGDDHGFDETPSEACPAFREWLGKALLE